MAIRSAFRFFFTRFLSVVFCIALLSAFAQQEPSCGGCHDQGKKLPNSAHASLSCDTCHEGYEKVPHPAGLAKPACATCHTDQAAGFEKSVHGMAAKK
ncbi:MAG: hypothetical protein EHM35_16415, partial [Planctomycetaceae bacterium]